jgi:exopolysaccharide biosynthesis protein
MKKISVIFCVQLWTILLFVSAGAQDFKTVRDGVEYAELERAVSGKPVKMNLLRLDLTKVRLDVVHALDSAIGLETTSSIAARHGALAAINAGFFRLDTSIFAGENVSLLMINGQLLSENINNRTSLFIVNEESSTRTNIEKGNPTVRFFGKKFNEIVSGINRERKNDELILYTPEFNSTTLTDGNGIEAVIKKGKVVRVFSNKGSNSIPADGFILSASGKFSDKLRTLRIGSKIKSELSFSKPITDSSSFDIPKLEDIVGGVPQLIKNGKIEITWEQEKTNKAFVETRHRRTAVAKLKDGKFLMVTVDGRSESSGGIGLEDLAKLLLEFGATDAMNLDGGGSTTMYLDGKVVNKPSDKEGERRISDAILVFPRKKQ